MAREFLQVDPRTLRLPWSRKEGADSFKLARQIAHFGTRTDGMPLIEVTRAKDGELVINSGVTRATRVAKMLPGQSVNVEVIDQLPKWDVRRLPLLGDTVP